MRLRLAHTLSLALLAFAAMAVLALGGLTAWNPAPIRSAAPPPAGWALAVS
jgi:hypothetical protein